MKGLRPYGDYHQKKISVIVMLVISQTMDNMKIEFNLEIGSSNRYNMS